jgi:hypothetical protein
MTTPPNDDGGDGLHRSFPGIVALLTLALAASVRTAGVLMTNDGPQHLFAAWVRQHLGDSDAPFGWHFQPNATLTHR